MKRVICQAL